eukprot:TRINITY_DN47757_c0_g1_i1.p1 TRINITY_DN47757_c0_g1~~TRINITY_DN47757_c0_g1_i1.p1  ORF type:complete len:318 (-),score=26.52 TRINITY_DN47757_c0_g1_i1:650-1603(-)
MLQSEITAVNCTFERFLAQLTSITQSVQSQWEEFKSAENETKLVTSPPPTESVTLNIGGTIFKTSKTTLLAEKDTFFWSMLRSGQWTPNAEGEYFVDRSPLMFGHLLQYLRSGYLVEADELREWEERALQDDIDFYQVHSLLKQHDTHLSASSPPLAWDVSGQVADKKTVLINRDGKLLEVINSPYQFFCAPLGSNLARKTVLKWKVVATRQGGSLCSSVGVGNSKWPEGENRVMLDLSTGEVTSCGRILLPLGVGVSDHCEVTFEWDLTLSKLMIRLMCDKQQAYREVWFPWRRADAVAVLVTHCSSNSSFFVEWA